MGLAMNCWERLGIDPTPDLRAVKRAYTRLLRKHSPETDPEGFQSLRAAYEEAQFLARLDPDEDSGSGEEEAAAGPADPVAEALPAGAAARPGGDAEPRPEPVRTHDLGRLLEAMGMDRVKDGDLPAEDAAAVEALMAKVAADFPDHGLRESEAYWRGLADNELLWNLAAKARLRDRLLEFFGGIYLDPGRRYTDIHVPGASWEVLDGAFGWLENEAELYASHPAPMVDAVLDRVRAARGLATSADLPGGHRRARDLLLDVPESGSKYRFGAWILWVLVLAVLHLYRCH